LVVIATAPGKDPARLAAIAALGRIGGAEARRALEQILANPSEEEVVRTAAFKALRRLLRAAQIRYVEGQDKDRRGAMQFAAAAIPDEADDSEEGDKAEAEGDDGDDGEDKGGGEDGEDEGGDDDEQKDDDSDADEDDDR
jgi:HEAT repeat protein